MARYDGTGDFDLMATVLNNSLEDGNNISILLNSKVIEDNRHMCGILELQVSYKTTYKENDTS